ncbi:MAG: hypothetical protein Q9192_005940 [Flavoplaca navasiana]
MAFSISTSIIVCLKAFNAFVEDLQALNGKNPANFLLINAWQDELGRLRIWAANVGAHQTNQLSLDYRLRDSSHIREQIVNLLDKLMKRLDEAENAINGEGDDLEDTEVESLDGSVSDDEGLQTDVHHLQSSVATLITCLFQMSMLVRKPAQHDIRVGSREIEVAAFETFDKNHVRDKYPKAEDFIVSRLGSGLTRRRKYLKYRERHALKLKQGINAVAEVNDDANSGIVLSETLATDVQDWNVQSDDNASQSGFSQTSYAPTLKSGGHITIPVPPRSSRGGAPFECPYCYFIVVASSERSWHGHVFQDLQPYVCLEQTCSTPQKLYTTRHEWVHHTNTMHRSEELLVAGSDKQEKGGSCILCKKPQRTRQQYDRHVARHLQELALFVLPRNDEELDDEESDDDEADDEEPGTKSESEGSFKNEMRICCRCDLGNEFCGSGPSCIVCQHTACSRCLRPHGGAVDIRSPASLKASDDDGPSPTNQEEREDLFAFQHEVRAKKRWQIARERQAELFALEAKRLRESQEEYRAQGHVEEERARILQSHRHRHHISSSSERSLSPDRMSSLPGHRRGRRKTQPPQGDAVLIGFLGGLNPPDVATRASEEPLQSTPQPEAGELSKGTDQKGTHRIIQIAQNALSPESDDDTAILQRGSGD